MPPKKEKATALDGIKRVIVDRLVFAPPFLLLFLYVITILEVSTVDSVFLFSDFFLINHLMQVLFIFCLKTNLFCLQNEMSVFLN